MLFVSSGPHGPLAWTSKARNNDKSPRPIFFLGSIITISCKSRPSNAETISLLLKKPTPGFHTLSTALIFSIGALSLLSQAYFALRLPNPPSTSLKRSSLGAAIAVPLILLALISTVLAGLDLLLSNGNPGEFLAMLTAWPMRLLLSTRQFRGVVNFEPRGNEKVRQSAVRHHNYLLPKWWDEFLAMCTTLEGETHVILESCQRIRNQSTE
jgi:hypothetical protein